MGTDGNPQEHSAPLAERLLGVVGGVVVLVLLGFLVTRVVSAPGTPPELRVVVTGIEPTGEEFVVRVRVDNHGGETAQGVEVSGRLELGAMTEQAQATIDYVPPESHRDGALVFGSDPATGELTVGAAGYALP